MYKIYIYSFILIFSGLLIYIYIDKIKENIDFLKNIIGILPIPKYIKNILIVSIEYMFNKRQKNKFVRRSISNMTKKKIASRQEWKCNTCNKLLDYTYEIDHINPLYKGGSNLDSNLQALCPICHAKKTYSGY